MGISFDFDELQRGFLSPKWKNAAETVAVSAAGAATTAAVLERGVYAVKPDVRVYVRQGKFGVVSANTTDYVWEAFATHPLVVEDSPSDPNNDEGGISFLAVSDPGTVQIIKVQ